MSLTEVILEDGVRKWVAGFNKIPTEIFVKLVSAGEDIYEVTPVTKDDEDCDFIPMWGAMWSFNSSADNWWLDDSNNLQKMADCGFRIYRQEDFEYIFGIDGGGYDFYEAHWIPLYKARGLQWHL
jgi:hypothetical protein